MTSVPSDRVEDMARSLDGVHAAGWRQTITDASGMLRSLAAERDALLAKVEAVEEWAASMLVALSTAGASIEEANSVFVRKKAAFERGADEP